MKVYEKVIKHCDKETKAKEVLLSANKFVGR